MAAGIASRRVRSERKVNIINKENLAYFALFAPSGALHQESCGPGGARNKK